jgi:FkbM family methyltransferase
MPNQNNNFEQPPILPRVFLNIYLFLARIGFRNVPKFKGAFFHLYRKINNKKGTIKVRTNDGNLLYIDLEDQIVSGKLLQYGFWEEGLTALIKHILKPGMNVVDVGAHVGYYSVLFSALVAPNGQVTSFEPDTHNNSLLRANIRLNHIDNCQIEDVAVSNNEEDLVLHLDPENLGAHSVVNFGNSNKTVEIRSTSLDSYFKKRGNTRVDFMKIDIEGWEEMALLGAEEILSLNKEILIVLEFNPNAMKELNKEPGKFLEKIRSMGFIMYTVGHKNGDIEKHDSNQSIIDFCGNGLVNLFLSRKEISSILN